ncbi:LppM family (lipo)protein [Sanguibacter sp. A247]|uniref:LppM family (lipo)protein n=1 Tax=unclassified Sanguibacter TaxID=2645534 RepID=UPI003FD86C80
MRAGRQASTRRRSLAALLAVAALVVLSACGARIDTTLVLGNNGSGERVMRLTLSEADVEDVKGGVKAIEKSVRAHLPAPLTMSEVTKTDDGYVATMTLAFTDVTDYTTKVTELLTASGSDIVPEIEHTISATAFLRGTSLRENFTSADLLGWVGKGLLADKLVEQDAADAAVENGTTVAKVGETEHETGSYLRVSEMEDHGVRRVEVTTSQAEVGFSRVAVLSVPAETYAADAAGLDAALAALAPAGATVEPSDEDGDHQWTVTFSGDAAAIAAGTDKLLGTTGSVWSWTESQGPKGQVVEVVDTMTCGTTCSPNLSGLRAQHVVPAEWAQAGDHWVLDEIDGLAYVRSDSEGKPSVYEVPLTVTRVDATLDVARSGAGSATFVFALPTTAAGDGAAIESALRPDDGAGTLARTDDGTTTRVTVTIEGDTAEELEERLDAYSGIDYSARDEGSLFAIDLGLRFSLDLGERLSTAPTEGMHVKVTLPFGAKAEVGGTVWGAEAKADGRTITWVDEGGHASYVTADVTGTTVAGLVRNAVVGLLVLALAGVVVWQRRRIATWWRTTQAASLERTQALGVTNDLADAGSSDVPGSPAARPSDAFTEAQLR